MRNDHNEARSNPPGKRFLKGIVAPMMAAGLILAFQACGGSDSTPPDSGVGGGVGGKGSGGAKPVTNGGKSADCAA